MTLLSIQYQRAIAALMVVAYHLGPQLQRMGLTEHWPVWLSAGVDIFFVISGCIMWVTSARRTPSPVQFYWNRVSRIVPLYYLLTTFTVALLVVAPSLLQTSRFEAMHVAASYLFIPFPHPVTGALEPVVFAGWTLNYEMFFYLIFGACLVLPEKARMAATVAVLGALTLAGAFVPQGPTLLNFFTSSLLLEFALGMGLGRLFLNGRVLARLPGFALMIAGFFALPALTLAFPEAPRLAIFGLPALAIVAGGLSLDQRGHVPVIAPARLLGDASYSIYLTHGMAISALGQVARKIGLSEKPFGGAMFGVIGMLVAAIIGLIVYAAVEKPLIGVFRRIGRRPAPQPAIA